MAKPPQKRLEIVVDNSVNPSKGKTAVRPVVQQLKDRPRASVLIVGGGINGVGTFRDLSLQGVDVALVERGDYCQGASGASSHMIHGGIRYLENGEFRLVHESVVERNALLRLAPHYVKPLQTTIPITSTFSGITAAPMRFLTHKQGKHTERGAVLIKAGLLMYDFFSRGGRVAPRHNFVGKKKSLQELPKLRSDVKYTATYFDASVHNPERLTLDVLRDGLEANKESRASNYVSAVGTTDAGTLLRDELTGEEFLFEADVVINATGAWVDETNDSFGKRTSFMGGTKGSHIVLDHPELLEACNGRELFFEHTDGRIVLIYPMGDRVLVGTTDIDADITEDSICTDEEIEYFFELVAHVFPTIDVRRDHIVYTFSGVRPLPRHDDTQPGFGSRDYRIEKRSDKRGSKNVTTLSLVGGKWTTFRALSENLASEAMTALGMPRKTATSELAIGGGRDFPRTEAEERLWVNRTASEVADRDRVRVLLTRYGTRATDVLAFLAQGGDQLLASTPELSTRELTYMVENEQVTRLSDILIRRTSLAFRGLVTEEMLNELAGLLAPQLGWDDEEARTQVKAARELLVNMHGMKIPAAV
ncbi:glycerol-3-phosphate dehydrogenase/oxidase [Arthrobacter sp. APC 3897]|uniref:glycerol-3-phosphate dehydrogenase/oxidase n=1 Tax=Arthrobacter sp. APC 3897 TaxID=3035204 RepID=UPI0025B47D6D|nr:glycerol-3-phosphate dehydrogenase/oxidase [Arthrobacter sp. APC 3897]MDN3481948.1 glycerol-3-phosphate dehydrogenase/oxidase [Arthrobacter sp. APC 3897]